MATPVKFDLDMWNMMRSTTNSTMTKAALQRLTFSWQQGGSGQPARDVGPVGCSVSATPLAGVLIATEHSHAPPLHFL